MARGFNHVTPSSPVCCHDKVRTHLAGAQRSPAAAGRGLGPSHRPRARAEFDSGGPVPRRAIDAEDAGRALSDAPSTGAPRRLLRGLGRAGMAPNNRRTTRSAASPGATSRGRRATPLVAMQPQALLFLQRGMCASSRVAAAASNRTASSQKTRSICIPSP